MANFNTIHSKGTKATLKHSRTVLRPLVVVLVARSLLMHAPAACWFCLNIWPYASPPFLYRYQRVAPAVEATSRRRLAGPRLRSGCGVASRCSPSAAALPCPTRCAAGQMDSHGGRQVAAMAPARPDLVPGVIHRGGGGIQAMVRPRWRSRAALLAISPMLADAQICVILAPCVR